MFSQQIETDKIYHRKAYTILFWKKYIVSLSKFSQGGSFLYEILQVSFTFLVLQFIQAVPWYNS